MKAYRLAVKKVNLLQLKIHVKKIQMVNICTHIHHMRWERVEDTTTDGIAEKDDTKSLYI